MTIRSAICNESGNLTRKGSESSLKLHILLMKCGVMPKLNFLLLLCAFIAACSRDPNSTTTSVTPSPPPAPKPDTTIIPTPDTASSKGVDVYVAGYESNESVWVAKYWKNGQAVALTDGTKNAIARSIAVVDSDVYVAGNNDTGPMIDQMATWKNGQVVALGPGTSAYSIAVTGSDIYVAGVSYSAVAWLPSAKCWKNGQDLLNIGITTRSPSYLNSITVIGSDVSVAGGDHNGFYEIAEYWKNGQPVALSDGTKSAWAYSIAVTGSDVYVAGDEDSGSVSVAKYWKNGQAVALTDGAKSAGAYSIVIMDSDVYVAGYENKGSVSVAKYWKNGQAVALTEGRTSAWASSIAVVNGDVYVAGEENNGSVSVAKYWKNGQAVALTDGTKSAGATSIVVVKR